MPRKRKIADLEMTALHVLITAEAREKLDRLKGRDSLGAIIEKMVDRFYRRALRKTLQELK